FILLELCIVCLFFYFIFRFFVFFTFFFNVPATTDIYTLSLHDALPISSMGIVMKPLIIALCIVSASSSLFAQKPGWQPSPGHTRSEEHTSELQSRFDLVCRLLLEKKKKKPMTNPSHITSYNPKRSPSTS